MKKSILNLGNPLNKVEQKQINGGNFFDSLISPGDQHDGWQCCNDHGCSECIPTPTGTCVSFPGAWGQSCKVG